MASASPVEGAHVLLIPTAVRAELTPAAGARAPGVRVPAVLLTAEGRAVHTDDGGRAAAGAEVDLRALPGDVARVLFRVPPAAREPGLLLRLLRAADAGELASLALPPGTSSEGGELYRTDGRWAFRAAPPGTSEAAHQESGAGELREPGVPAQDEPRVPAQGIAPAPETVVAPRTAPGTAPAPGTLVAPVYRRLALRSEQVAVSLVKYGAAGAGARVVVVLDASASLSGPYADGIVADVVERTAAVAAVLGAGRMQAWTFATHPARLPDCTVAGLPEWLRLHVRAGQLALLGRPRRRKRGLHPDQIDMRSVGVRNEAHKAMAQVLAHVRDRPVPVPTLVVFLSGGGVRRDEEIQRQLAEGADEPLFWQFVGLGRAADYGVLARLGRAEGGHLGNAGFFAVDDVSRTSDAELYDRLLCAFPDWLAAARRSGVVD